MHNSIKTSANPVDIASEASQRVRVALRMLVVVYPTIRGYDVFRSRTFSRTSASELEAVAGIEPSEVR